MASVKIILKSNKLNKKNEAPLYLRIIKDRKIKYISIGVSVNIKDWNEADAKVRKSHPNSNRINNFIAQKVAEAHGIAIEMETASKYVHPKSIKEAVLGKSSTSFTVYASKYENSLKLNGNYGTYKRVKTVLEKINKYTKNTELTFNDITVTFLKNYEQYMRSEFTNRTNTIHANFKIIKKIFNDAIDEDLVPLEKNPFQRYKLKLDNVEKEFLTEKELLDIEKLKLAPGSMIYHHRNIFVFAAYSGGIRISDIFKLKWENFDGERLLLNTQKTGSTVSIKLPLKSIQILNLYKKADSKPEHYIFPFLKNDIDYKDREFFHKTISALTSYTNSDLKEIAKQAKVHQNLHFHTSRHTWATRALRKGMRIEYVSKLMGHTSIKTTQVYAKIVNEELDKAMDVFNDPIPVINPPEETPAK